MTSCDPFLPHQGLLDEPRQSLPRYLFRAYSPRSNGQNTKERIGPQHPALPPSSSGPCDAETLIDHLSWRKTVASEFVSWTSSILWALVHAIRKFKNKDWNDPGRGVCLAVLDTATVPEDVLVYRPTRLLGHYQIPDGGKIWRDRYDHEYLVHGAVTNDPRSRRRFDSVAIEELVDDGFFVVFPPFDNPTKELAARVPLVRSLLGSMEKQPETSDLSKIAKMAGHLDGKFRLPMVLSLVALFPIDAESEDFNRLLQEQCLHHIGVPVSHFGHPFANYCSGDEVGRFGALLQVYRASTTDADVKDLENGLQGLSIKANKHSDSEDQTRPYVQVAAALRSGGECPRRLPRRVNTRVRCYKVDFAD